MFLSLAPSPGFRDRYRNLVQLVRAPGDAFSIRRPVTPTQFFRNRGSIIVFKDFLLRLAVVKDLEKEHPDKLVDSLRITIDTSVLAHDVLNRFYYGAY